MGVWLGVPYASARRWEAPALVPFDPDRAYDRFGPSAVQDPDHPLTRVVPGQRVGEVAEDGCLTLNVWAPDGADGLPVLVWVHGGAYVIGGSSLATYDGRRLSEEGVVVVSLNYRLGALGFLCRPGGEANLGSQDQLAALRWVQEHIARFGGDPANVTIFGESAGAGSILHLLGMPAGDGLFHRAILQSPGAEVVRRPLAEDLAAAFDRHLGDGDDVLGAQEAAAAELASRFGSMPWAPVVDGALLPASPQERIAAGEGPAIDVLLGTTATELSLFTGQLHDAPARIIAKVAAHLLGPILERDPDPEACRRLVARYAQDETGDLATEVLSDAAMGVPSLQLLDDLARRGRTFSYRFNWRAPRVDAFHACDLPFTFGTLGAEGWDEFVGADAAGHELSDRMRKAWASFARTGDPGWDAYDTRTRSTLIFGRTDRLAEHPVARRRHHFEEEGLLR